MNEMKRIAVVTGASSGMGREFVMQLNTFCPDLEEIWVLARRRKRLEQLDEILKLYHVEEYVSYELAMLSRLEYYTGIIFAGYTFGTGEAIVKGGRYDDLLTYFGKQAPATGFAIVIDQLMAALSRQNIRLLPEEETEVIFYTPSEREEAIRKAQKLRQEGHFVALRPRKEERR